MTSEILINEKIEVHNAPDIPGLTFRGFRGEEDYQHMVAVITTCKREDDAEWSVSVEDVTRNYSHLERCDPYKDMLFTEVDGEVIGYGRGWWDEELDGNYLYTHFVYLLPAWRGKGIGRAMSGYFQNRLGEIASEHPPEAPKFYQVWVSDTEKWQEKLYTEDGFEAVRFALSMTRLCSELIDPLPLPEGIEVRPSIEEHFRKVWDAMAEAFRDHWGYVEPTEENYKEWQEEPTFQPDLWKVAWDGEEVVGMVLNFIHHDENEEYKRKRGYTEGISVRRSWRKRSVARALLTQSIKMFQEMGMEDTALSVDTQNPNGAKRLYESVGYKEIKRQTTYRKALE
jgi:ribosomal protein S18 acetylase RimI-like enzyme